MGVVLALIAMAISPVTATADPSKHEIRANWLGGTPASVPNGQALIGEWHINTNDVTSPESNLPIDNVLVTITATNGVFTTMPTICKTTGVTPASSISDDGVTLVCNLGTIIEGTATVVQAPIRASGANVGDMVSAAGTVQSDSAPIPVGPAAVTPVPITFSYGLDLSLNEAPGRNYQGAIVEAPGGGQRQQMIMNFAFILENGSRPGPASYTFPVTISNATPGALMTGLQVEECRPIDNRSQALNMPYSAPQFADRTNFPACNVVPTNGAGTTYSVTVSNLDYTLVNTPTNDSLGGALPVGVAYIASGSVVFSLPDITPVTTTYTFTATPPPFTFANGTVEPEMNPSNNTSTATVYTPGGFSNAWYGTPTAARSQWDDRLYLPQGASLGTVLPQDPQPGPGVPVVPYLPLYHQVNNRTWVGYEGPGGQIAESCTMTTSPSFVTDYVDFGAWGTSGYHNLPSGQVFYTTSPLNTKTETCENRPGGPVWIAAPAPAPGSVSADPRLADDNLVALPAGINITGVKMVYDPNDVQGQDITYLRVLGHIDPNAPIGSEGWTVGAGKGPAGYFNNSEADPSGTLTPSAAETPWSQYARGTNGYRDVYRIIGAQGIITKATAVTTAVPGVPVQYSMTAAAQISVPNPPLQNFTVVDTLPAGMVYVAGSASPAPSSVVGQVITWTFTNVPANQAQPITYQAQTPITSTLPPGTQLTNTAVVNVPGDARDEAQRSASATVVVPNSSSTSLGKSAQDNILSFLGDTSAWELTINSQDPMVNPFTDTIDILPFKNNFGVPVAGQPVDTTTIDGTYTITGVTAPPGATVYYTASPVASLSNDPRFPSNGGTPGSVAGNTVGWSTTPIPHPTAIRVIAGALQPGATQVIRILFSTPAAPDCLEFAPTDNKPGQQIVNNALSIAGHTGLPMLSSARTTIGDCYALDIKKYVLAKGGDPTIEPGEADSDWHDAEDVADFQQYAFGDEVPYRIVVTNKGTGALEDVLVTDSLIPDCTNTVDLAPRNQEGDTASFDCTLPDAEIGTTVNTATASVTPPDGPPLTPSDNAGIVVPDPFVVEKTSDTEQAAIAGSTVTYTITVTEPEGSDAPFPNPSLTDDLAEVLDDAVYNDDAVVTPGEVGEDAGTVQVVDGVLAWTADQLMPGQTLTITYSVTVDNPSTGDHELLNTVVTPPNTSNCSELPDGQAPGDITALALPNAAECTVVLPVQSFEVIKTVNSLKANPGDLITYTIEVVNTGNVDYTEDAPAAFIDDISEVLDDATYNDDAVVDGLESPDLTYSEPILAWSGALPVGGSLTITYTVTADAPNAGDKALHNPVVTPPNSGGNCPEGTENPQCFADVPAPGIHVVKTVDVRKAAMGQVVTYTITVINTGKVAFTAEDPASFTDDMTKVLDDAEYNGDASNGATFAGSALSWSGPLGVAQSTTIVYTVTVKKPNPGNFLMDNTVTTPPELNGNCSPGSTDPDCLTHTPVEGYTVKKTVSAQSLRPGETVTYTIVVANIGQYAYTVADPARFADDMSDVLDDGDYNNDATGGATYLAPVLSWQGALAIGGTASVTYTVTVDSPDTGNRVLNNVVTTPFESGVSAANCPPGSSDRDCAARATVAAALAVTGADAQLQLILAMLLIGGGAAMLVGQRRRRAAAE